MSRKRKGRKHRTVNRTPRPVRRAVTATPVGAPVPRPATAATATTTATPATTATATPMPSPARSVESLGRHLARTYEQLGAHGPQSAEELCETAGYTVRTITRHLADLARQGLAEQAADGRWAASPSDPRTVAVG